MIIYTANFTWEVYAGISFRKLNTPVLRTANVLENCVTFAVVISVIFHLNFNKALALDLVWQLQALRSIRFTTNTHERTPQ